MSRWTDIAAERRTRRGAQLIALLLSATAVALLTLPDTWAQAIGSGLVAGLALLAFKLALVSSAQLSTLPAAIERGSHRIDELELRLRHIDIDSIARELDGVSAQLVSLRDHVEEQLNSRLGPDAEASAVLIRRVEPVIAQVAIILNEQRELRDFVTRVDRRLAALPGESRVSG